MPFRVRGKAPAVTRGSGELRVMQRLSEYEFGVELWLMRDGRNDNRWDYRNIREYYRTFMGQPILVAYVLNRVGDGHNKTERRDPRTGELYYSFMDGTAERIVGTLSDEEDDFSLVERDGHTWIVAKGRLFAFYARELVDMIVRTGRMEVSAETMVDEEHEEDGYQIYTKWTGIGVTILGESVPPAIPGARIAALSAMQDEFKTLKLRAASLHTPGGEDTKKKGVTRSMNKTAAKALEAKFPGFRVVALSADERNVGLIDDAGNAFTYAFNAEDNGEVVMGRMKPAHLTTQFHFSENEAAEAEVSDIVDRVYERVKNNESAAEGLRKDLEAANAKVKAMEKAEDDRRLNAAKAAVTATLAAFNANRADKIGQETVQSVMKQAEEGFFTNCVDKDGGWTGEEAVRSAVLAACAAAVMEADRQAAEKRKSHFVMDGLNRGGHGDQGGIVGLLQKNGIELAPHAAE